MIIKVRNRYKAALDRLQEEFRREYPGKPVPTYPQIVEALLATYLDQLAVDKIIIRK